MTGMIVLTAASEHSRSFDPTVLLTWFTCLSILVGGALAVLKYGRKVMLMVEDFNGTPSRPGVEARPGVMSRMSSMETQAAEHGARLEVIHAEVNYNHGGSIKDAVDRMDKRLEGVDGDVQVLKRQNVEKLRRLGDIETTISGLHGQYLERMEGVDADLKGLHDTAEASS